MDTTFGDLLSGMTKRYSVILHQLGGDKNEEARFGNFINNPKVTPDRILSHHWDGIGSDWGKKHLLVISDSSTMSFDHRADREELGFVGPKTKKTGFDIHPSIFLDAQDGGLQGVGGLDIIKKPFARTAKEKKAQAERRKDKWKTPFEEKERYKWFTSPKQAIGNGPPAAQYTLVGDRETDIYDLIARTLENNWGFLYRSKTDRLLSTDKGKGKLHGAIARWEVEHTYEIIVRAAKSRSKHKAVLGVKFGKVSIARPKSHTDRTLPGPIPLQVVEVKEKAGSVIGGEDPVHWILLTSHPVDSVEQALQIVQWYQWRWTIEELFRTLKKKGLNMEASEVETFHGLSNLTTIALLAAAQTMQLVKARDGQTSQKTEDVFFEKERECLFLLNEKLEGNTLKLKNPYAPESLAFATWVIARLGGWNGYKKAKPPGPIIITRGLAKFYSILQGFYLIL